MASSSSQVYASDQQTVPNVYLSQIVYPDPDLTRVRGAVVNSLNIRNRPAVAVPVFASTLVRNGATGNIEIVQGGQPLSGFGSVLAGFAAGGQVILPTINSPLLWDSIANADVSITYAPLTGTFTLASNGLYSMSLGTAFTSNNNSIVAAWVAFGGTSATSIRQAAIFADQTLTAGVQSSVGSWSGYLPAGTTLQCLCFQNSLLPLVAQGPTTDSANACMFSLIRLTPAPLA